MCSRKVLLTGFKGKNNSSGILVQAISQNYRLLTNSFNGVKNIISDTPGNYLCNEAYWYALQKFNNKAVFIHIPTIKNLDDGFINKMKKFVKGALRGKPPLEGVVSYKEANQGKAFPLLWI